LLLRLRKKIGKNIELVKGDITKTIPEYLEKYSKLKIIRYGFMI